MKKINVIVFALLMGIFNGSCSNSTNSGTVQNLEKTKNDISNNAENTKQKPSKKGNSTVQAKLDKAKKAGKAVFIVVTGSGSADTEKALNIAKEASKTYQNATVLQMNRDDNENVDLVNKWKLSSAPLPLILVVSTKGNLTGGLLLKDATAKKLADLIPSPKLESVYEAVGNSKYAIVAFTKKSFINRTKVIEECKKAVSMLNNEAVFIEVDMDDTKENSFMQKLRINPLTAKSCVSLVINKQGQVTGQSTTIPDAAKLVSAAKTPVRSGCGPGCGSGGCGK